MTSGAITEVPAGTVEKSDNTMVSPSESAMPDPLEPAAGAVYEIPAESASAPTAAGPLCAKVTAIQSLHLRDQPNEKARVLAYLQNGEQVRIIHMGHWWKIETEKGAGYANAKYLQITECK